MNENYYDVSEDTIADFFEVFNKKTFITKIDFQFIGFKKQKSLIKITKIPDQYVHILEKSVLVTINEDLMDVFDEESRTILIEQEIDKINIHSETGKIKLNQPDLNTFSGLINKYGIDKISRANQVESLVVEQTEDKNNEFIV